MRINARNEPLRVAAVQAETQLIDAGDTIERPCRLNVVGIADEADGIFIHRTRALADVTGKLEFHVGETSPSIHVRLTARSSVKCTRLAR